MGEIKEKYRKKFNGFEISNRTNIFSHCKQTQKNFREAQLEELTRQI